jgi:hypothetical protein
MTGTDKRSTYLSLPPYWAEVAAKSLVEASQTIVQGWLCSDPDARTGEPLEAAEELLRVAREMMRK